MRLILSIIMLVASIAGFAIFIVPEYQDIQKLRVEKEDYNQILANARKLQEQRKKLVDKYNTFDPIMLGKLQTMLPTNPENVNLILEIDSIARQYGLVVQNVKIEDPAQQTPSTPRPGSAPVNNEIGTLDISFALAGPYAGFTSFVKMVEKNLRVVDFEKITFTNVDETKQSYQYSVGIKTYWLK